MERGRALAHGGMRKGFTLMEIVFVVVIIAILAGLIIPRITANSTKTQIAGQLNSDLKQIAAAVRMWKKESVQYATNKNFQDFDARSLKGYLSSDMPVPSEAYDFADTNVYAVDSANVRYILKPCKDVNDNDSVTVVVDFRPRIAEEDWSDDIKTFATQKAAAIIDRYFTPGPGNTQDNVNGLNDDGTLRVASGTPFAAGGQKIHP